MEDIEATIQHVSRTQPDIFFTTVSYPIKGTPYYKKVQNDLIQLAPWGMSSDREIKIRGRHSRRYYSFADKLLRSEVALARMRAVNAPDEQEVSRLAEEIRNARTGLMDAAAEVEA